MASSGIPQIDQLIQRVVRSNDPQDRMKALQALNQMIQSSPQLRGAIAQGLRDNGLGINAQGQVVSTSTGLPPTGSTTGVPTGNAWAAARAQMGPTPLSAEQTTRNNMSAGRDARQQQAEAADRESKSSSIYTGVDPSTIKAGGIPEEPIGPGSPGEFSNASISTDPIFTSRPEFKNSFFGNVQGDAIDELAADPQQAWSLFRTRGGPGGRSLQNSTASLYGANDFESAMNLAPFLASDGLLSPADQLGFTDQMMKRGMSGGGNYVDPSKVLNAAFENIGKDPNFLNQQTGIQTVLDAVAPYINQTQYQMLQRRIQDVMDRYLTYGLENGTEDLNGVLLDMVYNAIGQ